MKKRWTIADIEKTGLSFKDTQNSIVGRQIPKKTDTCQKNKTRIPKNDPEGLSDIKLKLRLLKVNFVTEHRFHPTRKFRFDVAILEHKVGIEYEGIVSEKSRHTGITGFTNDCTKYNLAQILGWKVLRYTTVNYKEFYFELKKIITDL